MIEFESAGSVNSRDGQGASAPAAATAAGRRDSRNSQWPLGRRGWPECQDSPDWVKRYRDFKSLCADVSGEYIRFYLTTGCEQINYAHSQNTAGLPIYSCRLTSTDGEELTLALDGWRGRMGEVPELVRAWLGEHSSLRGCKPAKSHYQGDRYWLKRWQQANPW